MFIHGFLDDLQSLEHRSNGSVPAKQSQPADCAKLTELSPNTHNGRTLPHSLKTDSVSAKHGQIATPPTIAPARITDIADCYGQPLTGNLNCQIRDMHEISGIARKRENLSPASKKLNHVVSEQRRRDQLRDGFVRMAALTPLLKGKSSQPKHVVLQHAADYIVLLQAENERLRALATKISICAETPM